MSDFENEEMNEMIENTEEAADEALDRTSADPEEEIAEEIS